MSQVQGGGNRVMSFGRSKAKLVNKDTPKTTFADVAGADEAIEELDEIKEFLAEPGQVPGASARRSPRACCSTARPAPARPCSRGPSPARPACRSTRSPGSDFVEMFVGVGASRVRDLFEQAKTNAPAIIFVDEIDAVGRHRGAGLGGGHDEREQTLNQLLVEMDGFDVKGGVILIAATNRPTSSTRRCCGRAASTARSPSARPTSKAARPSCGCTPRASRSRPTSISTSSPAARLASPAPTWPT